MTDKDKRKKKKSEDDAYPEQALADLKNDLIEQEADRWEQTLGIPVWKEDNYERALKIDRLTERPSAINTSWRYSTAFQQMSNGLRKSFWAQEYPEAFHNYLLSEQAGLDKCKINLVIKGFDPEKFQSAIEAYSSPGHCPRYPHVNYAPSRPDSLTDISILGYSLPYSQVTIQLSAFESVKFGRINSMSTEEGIGHTYCTVTTLVRWDTQLLGNLRNYSYRQEQAVLDWVLGQLESKFFVTVDRTLLLLESVELNSTFDMPCRFIDLKRPLSYCKSYIRKGYTIHEYSYPSVRGAHFPDGLKPYVDYPAQGYSGMEISCNSVKMKLYDKARETAASVKKGTGIPLLFEEYGAAGPRALVRLEFSIHRRKQIQAHLGNANFAGYSQFFLEQVYRKLVQEFLIQPYSLYYSSSTSRIRDYFRTVLDPSSDRQWKRHLVNDFLSHEIGFSAPLFLNAPDIDELIELVPTFKRNKSTYRKVLHDILHDSPIYERGDERNYDILFAFIDKASHRQGISSVRQICYIDGSLLQTRDSLYMPSIADAATLSPLSPDIAVITEDADTEEHPGKLDRILQQIRYNDAYI